MVKKARPIQRHEQKRIEMNRPVQAAVDFFDTMPKLDKVVVFCFCSLVSPT